MTKIIVDDCLDIGFKHCWENITPNIAYPTNPITYPNQMRRCANCGMTEELILKQREIKEWCPLPDKKESDK